MMRIEFIYMVLEMINELYQTNNDENILIARKYLNILKNNVYKFRLLDGSIVLYEYRPLFTSKL
jgi:hypothetical protein